MLKITLKDKNDVSYQLVSFPYEDFLKLYTVEQGGK